MYVGLEMSSKLNYMNSYEDKISEKEKRSIKVQDSVSNTKERLQLLIENAHDYAMFTTNQEGIIDNWNIGAERIFRYTESEIVGQHLEIIFTPEDRENNIPQKEIETATLHGRADDERWHLRKDGTRFYACGILIGLRDENGELKGYAKIAQDLTVKKRYEEELKTAHDLLEQKVIERTEQLIEAYAKLKEESQEKQHAEEIKIHLLNRLINIQEQERSRLSRELHDHLGQKLVVLSLQAEKLKEKCEGNEELLQTSVALQDLSRQINDDIKFIAWELRPTILDDLGLASALEAFVSEWSKHFGVYADIHITGLKDRRLPQEIETSLYRITQEALNNIAHHAEAKRAAVIVKSSIDEVVLVIEDDGKGFDVEAEAKIANGAIKKLGILGMRERVALIKGNLEIESKINEGTAIFVRVSTPILEEKK